MNNIDPPAANKTAKASDEELFDILTSFFKFVKTFLVLLLYFNSKNSDEMRLSLIHLLFS